MKEKIKKIFLFTIVLLFSFGLFLNVIATSGACSWHGGVNCAAGSDWDGSVICNDGWRDSSVSYYSMTKCIQSPILSIPNCPLNSSYDSFTDSCKCYSGYLVSGDRCISKDQWCKDKYGYNSTNDYLSDNCKCTSGYIFGKDVLGNTACVSADQSCKDEYGVMARYNILYNKCECFVGYVFGQDIIGRTQCISEDNWCQNKYGYNSKYNSLSDKCVCKSGYEFTIKSGGSLECISCFSKYGIHSSYNYLTDKCECDDNYTLENNKCVIQEKIIICPQNSTNTGGLCLCNDGYINNGSICVTYIQNCQNKYGVNSYGDKNNCYCNSGYQWNSSKTSCVKIVCPINSSIVDNQCVCNDGYVYNGNSCITHTQDCINNFGQNVYGVKGNDNNSSCDCKNGYFWNLTKTACVKNEIQSTKTIMPPTTTITTTTTTTMTRPVTKTTKAIVEVKNEEVSISNQKIEAENILDDELINSSITEFQQEEIIKENQQNWFTKTLELISEFVLRLFK